MGRGRSPRAMRPAIKLANALDFGKLYDTGHRASLAQPAPLVDKESNKKPFQKTGGLF